ncbi:coiled-coil domain-containing protein [Helicobacter pylori]|uniref:coiled-coil domain-containing protein n=1 Tax=Helicobacter pylori TaxID=210 RepID=UPI00165ACE28|nr:OmpH family outer membrane protein [Helicobacter pylori]
MDLKGLENALNNGDFKEQVFRSLEGICQISKVLNQLDILKNFNEHNLEIIAKIQAMKNALADYETSGQELKVKINALVNSLETRKQELEALLNTQLQSVRVSEEEKLTQAASELKTQLIAELAQAKDNLAQALKPQIQAATKFLGIFIYGRQSFFKNESDKFRELFEFADIHLSANKNYIVQFSMPYELSTNGVYSGSMGEMVLCLKANSKVYPIINSFYQNKTSNLNYNNKNVDTYRINCAFKTPSEEADYKIACFARKHKDLWVNVNYSSNTEGFETSYLSNAHFDDLITHSLPTDYNNDRVFYKHSQAIVYEILK